MKNWTAFVAQMSSKAAQTKPVIREMHDNRESQNTPRTTANKNVGGDVAVSTKTHTDASVGCKCLGHWDYMLV